MPDGFSIDLSQITALQQRMQDLPDRLRDVIDIEIQEGAKNIAGEAKLRSEKSGVYGFLQNEIGSQRIAFMQAEVFSGALYSPYVEFGTRSEVSIPPGLEEYASQFKGSPPGTSSLSAKQAIFAWCKRRGVDEKLWYAIYLSIMIKGSKPHPFFFPAVNRQIPIIINSITKALVSEAFK